MSRNYGVPGSSRAWTISSVDLVDHLKTVPAPDALYWDSKTLKRTGDRFQAVPWSAWRKVEKNGDMWVFVP